MMSYFYNLQVAFLSATDLDAGSFGQITYTITSQFPQSDFYINCKTKFNYSISYDDNILFCVNTTIPLYCGHFK